MANRAVKNRLAHGYKTKMEGSGPTGRYTTERPPFTAKKGGQAKGRGYAGIDKPGYVKSKRHFSPRHLGWVDGVTLVVVEARAREAAWLAKQQKGQDNG